MSQYFKNEDYLAFFMMNLWAGGNIFRTYLKNNLSAHGDVAKRFKMLTYYVYAPLFHRFAPCLNTNLTVEIGSSILRIKLKLNFVQNVEPEIPQMAGGKRGRFAKVS